jgi:hypothetical protein
MTYNCLPIFHAHLLPEEPRTTTLLFYGAVYAYAHTLLTPKQVEGSLYICHLRTRATAINEVFTAQYHGKTQTQGSLYCRQVLK